MALTKENIEDKIEIVNCGDWKVIQVRKSESFDTFWTSSLKLQQNSDVESENIIQAFGSPVRTKCQSYHSLTHSKHSNTGTIIRQSC